MAFFLQIPRRMGARCIVWSGDSLGMPHGVVRDPPAGLEWLQGLADFQLELMKPKVPGPVWAALNDSVGPGVVLPTEDGDFVVATRLLEADYPAFVIRPAARADQGLLHLPNDWQEYVVVTDPDASTNEPIYAGHKSGRVPRDLSQYVGTAHGWKKD